MQKIGLSHSVRQSFFSLLEISHSAFKDLLILVSGDVLAYVRTYTLAVTHFSENTSVRRCNGFYSFI